MVMTLIGFTGHDIRPPGIIETHSPNGAEAATQGSALWKQSARHPTTSPERAKYLIWFRVPLDGVSVICRIPPSNSFYSLK